MFLFSNLIYFDKSPYRKLFWYNSAGCIAEGLFPQNPDNPATRIPVHLHYADRQKNGTLLFSMFISLIIYGNKCVIKCFGHFDLFWVNFLYVLLAHLRHLRLYFLERYLVYRKIKQKYTESFYITPFPHHHPVSLLLTF